MIKYLDISDWKKQEHLHTGGTRDKFIAISPNDEKFYFKTSLNRGNRNYKFEFWSEIIAYIIGKQLGFNVTPYYLASYNDYIGCLSKSIITEGKEEHHEGYRFIIQKYPEFTLNYKTMHSFQRIIGSLENLHLGHLKIDVIKMLIFDTIIGNTDRHSENWALVIDKREDFLSIEKTLELYDTFPFYKRKWISIFLFFQYFMTIGGLKRRFNIVRTKFSPIYDSGSSLGREHDDKKLLSLMLYGGIENYIVKGKPDIRWENEWLNHFDLLRKIKNEYELIFKDVCNDVLNNYSFDYLKTTIMGIDNELPEKFQEYKLSDTRKEFIIKYINLRMEKIADIYYEN